MRIYRRAWLVCVLLLAAMVVLSACGRGGSEPTPTPTKTPMGEQSENGAAPDAGTPTPADAGASTGAPATATEAATPTPGTKTVAVINAAILNVRSAPSTDGEVVQTVEQGEQYDVIGRSQDGEWIQIGSNGRELGWVSTEFVAEQTVAISPEGSEPEAEDDVAETPAETPAQAETQPPATGGGNYLPATMESPDFGAQAFLWWRPEVADRDLTLMSEANFRWVKTTFAWETIEGAGKGVYDWNIADRVVKQVNSHNLKLLARVSSDPEEVSFWAGAPPANGNDFADFVFALASRYNCTPEAVGCIQAYQIWNEPNLAREWGGNPPNPAQYVEFLGKAYAAIKRANPNAIVINAGMAPTGDNSAVAMADDLFYEGMYQAMGGSSNGYFDMLGVHGAGFAAPPELDPAEAAADQRYGGYRFFAFRHVEDIRAIMERNGDSNKRIVLLEFGWTYDPVNPSYSWHGAEAGITDMVQADYLRRAYQYAAANWQPWIGLMSLLTMPNLDWMADGNPQDEEQYWWAILEPSEVHELKLRPAFVFLCDYFNEVEGRECKYEPQ